MVGLGANNTSTRRSVVFKQSDLMYAPNTGALEYVSKPPQPTPTVVAIESKLAIVLPIAF